METLWFEDYIRSALPAAVQDHPQLGAAASTARAVASEAGGEVYQDVEADLEALARKHALGRFDHALGRWIHSRLPAHTPSHGGYAYVSLNATAEIRPRVGVNVAGPSTLASLPEIGEVLAARIVAHRRTHGPFVAEDVDQTDLPNSSRLSDVHGISVAMVGSIRHAIHYQQSADAPVPIYVPALQALRTQADIAGLLTALESDISLSGEAFDEQDDLVERLHHELKQLLEYTAGSRIGSGILAGVKASSLQAFDLISGAAEALQPLADMDEAKASLIFNGQYPHRLADLIDAATESIRVAMFYLVPGSTGVDNLLEKLIAAKDRGVNVSVILDRDQEGDVYNSRTINQAAFDFLQQAGVDVRFDAETSLMHAKAVVIDERITVLGSHNWTAGSFYNYEDVSIAADSVSVATTWAAWFDAIA